MIGAIAHFRDWLQRKRLDTTEVTLVVRLKDPREKALALDALKAGFRHEDIVRNFDHATDTMKINGINVRFEAKPWGHE